MQDELVLTVAYKGKELLLPFRLLQYTYTHKLEVDVKGTKIFFERDEERNWRALVSDETMLANKKLDTDLLEAIVESIDELLK